MELLFSGLSPFVRKVLVVAHELDIATRIRIVPANTLKEPEKVHPLNPLGKIPVLVTDSGSLLYDSPVICEYLDAEYGGRRLLPAGGTRRWEIMAVVALADGMLDAGILVRHERARAADMQSGDWLERQLGKVQRGLDHLEGRVDQFGADLDMGQIAIGCALGYLPLRVQETEGLPKWPRLREWYAEVSQRPAFQKTKPVT